MISTNMFMVFLIFLMMYFFSCRHVRVCHSDREEGSIGSVHYFMVVCATPITQLSDIHILLMFSILFNAISHFGPSILTLLD